LYFRKYYRLEILHVKPKMISSKDVRGSALVIVLAMVVLLTALILAYFSQSILDQKISHNYSNQTKADLFAQGTIDSVIAEFKQEIVANSSTTTVTTGSISTILYTPLATTNQVPSRESLGGLVSSATDLPNLVAMSSVDNPLYANGSILASVALSTGTSLNYRTISMARWNKPLLLPKDDTSSTDFTPKSSFFPKDGSKAPNWILTSRDGGHPTDWNNNLMAGAGNKEVVGRYAYMVYNEGGLLDANVAGGASLSALSGTLITTWNRKGSAALADLTKIGLTQNDINQLVGWRNYAGAQMSGVFPGYNLNSTALGNYFNYVIGQNTRFMTVSGSLHNGQSDHMFSSRQQLIQFLTQGVANSNADTARLQNSLQYLGTFSRSLNQPTYRPSTGEPAINTAVGLNVSSTTINVPFQNIRVSGSFTRNDGSIAQIGEPLVKKRFALSRLLWLTYRGPSQGGMTQGDTLFNSYVNRGMPAAEVLQLMAEGTTDNIHKYFGLTWSSNNGGYWTYDLALLVNGGLARLGDINGREPNFFELLKAGIHVGAIARLTSGSTAGDDLRGLDSQIIQIGANIINQARPDNFPCRIVFNNRAYWGTVDLPYLYELTTVAVLTRKGEATPALASNSPVAGSISDAGNVAVLDVPVIWNPHQNNTNPAGYANSPLDPNLTPRHLRICISSQNLSTSAAYTNLSASLNVDNVYQASTANNQPLGNTITAKYSAGSPDATLGYVDMAANNNALAFTNPANQTLYREPTPLLRPGVPANSLLQVADGNITGQVSEYGSGQTYLGFFMTNLNSLYPVTVSGTNYVYATNYIYGQPGGLFTVSLEYQDANNNWLPYRQVTLTKYPNQRASGIAYDYDAAAESSGTTGNPFLQSLLQTWRGTTTGVKYLRSAAITVNGKNWPAVYYSRDAVIASDPRLAWGPEIFLSDNGGSVGQWLDANKTEIQTIWPAAQPNDYAVTADMFHGYYYGNLSTNMQSSPPNNPYGNRAGSGGSDANGYYLDADGIVRRPMGGYSANNTIGLPLVTVVGQSGQISNRPIMLQRPFRSVAELGYVFANVSWRHLSMITPESGFNVLLDLFCLNEDHNANALEAGRVDLNGRQPTVFQAILTGAYRDEFAKFNETQLPLPLTDSESLAIANALVARTTQEPLTNVADLVGRYTTSGGLNNLGYAQTLPYNGFSADLPAIYSANSAGSSQNTDKQRKIMRLMESSIRALADAGQAGTWNLMIDVIAQTGRYPAGAKKLDDFIIEGEKRCWVHVAINRQTGKVIDQQIEKVDE
jgi:Tfp pilus assembly protein PilX